MFPRTVARVVRARIAALGCSALTPPSRLLTLRPQPVRLVRLVRTRDVRYDPTLPPPYSRFSRVAFVRRSSVRRSLVGHGLGLWLGG